MNVEKIEKELEQLMEIVELIKEKTITEYLNQLENSLPIYRELKKLSNSQKKSVMILDKQTQINKLRGRFEHETNLEKFTDSFEKIKGEFKPVVKKLVKWTKKVEEFKRIKRDDLLTVKNHQLLNERIHLAEMMVTTIMSYTFTDSIDIAHNKLNRLLGNILTYKSILAYASSN